MEDINERIMDEGYAINPEITSDAGYRIIPESSSDNKKTPDSSVPIHFLFAPSTTIVESQKHSLPSSISTK